MLDCASLAIFKAFFDRTKDWADLEAIAQATPEDIDAARGDDLPSSSVQDDPAVQRLESLIPLDVGSAR